jgi:flagellar biosynthetic protein FlhB
MISRDATEDRTEAPTPRRLLEARKQGQVAASRDLVTAIMLLLAAGTLYAGGSKVMNGLRKGLGGSLASLHEADASSVVKAALPLALPLAPLLLVPFVAGLAATLVQTGFLFTGETLRLNPERLDPAGGFRRTFSLRTFMDIAGGLAKGTIVLGVLVLSLWQERIALAGLSLRPLPEAARVLGAAALSMFVKAGLALLALGLLDWAYRRWQLHRDLRMSRREIQDELREFEGDPAIRNRRRSLRARLDEARLAGRVPGSDVVVIGGSCAAALKLEDGVPVLLASGKGGAADRIQEAAQSNGVPVIERQDLARSLHRHGSAGEPAPEALRTDAAEVVDLGRRIKESA